MAMRPGIKKKWLAALRSGTYMQGRGKLRPTPKTYCCLGVLLDLYRRSAEGRRAKARWVRDKDDNVFRFVAKKGRFTTQTGGVLHRCAVQWAGLPSHDPSVSVTLDGQDVSLSMLNDGCKRIRKHSFAQIAKVIEEQL